MKEIAFITQVRINTKTLWAHRHNCVLFWSQPERRLLGFTSRKWSEAPALIPGQLKGGWRPNRFQWCVQIIEESQWSPAEHSGTADHGVLRFREPHSAQHHCIDSHDGFGATQGGWFCFQIKHEPIMSIQALDIYLGGGLNHCGN